MPEFPNDVALPIFVGVAVILLGWFVIGNELMRRRAGRLAVWGKRTLDPMGGRQSIRWLTMHSFRLEVEQPKAPYRSASLTGLVEAWDVPINWLWNRLHGRRDIAMVQVTLAQAPIWGMEVFRPGSLFAGDARHFARLEAWAEEPLEEFRLAPAAEAPRALARELIAALGPHRQHLLRLAVRRQGAHLTLAINVADPGHLQTAEVARLLDDLARITARYATPNA